MNQLDVEENKDGLTERICFHCEQDWKTDNVLVFRCKLCNDNRYWCMDDGETKHKKKNHKFDPDRQGNPYLKELMLVCK